MSKRKGETKEIIHGRCRDLSYEGKGVVETEKGIVFVDGMFPSEEGDVRLLYSRNKQWFGEVAKLDKVSPYRIDPKCKICRACGGCQFQQLDYQKQLEFKSNKVKEQLRRIAKIDIEVAPTIGMDNPYFYRNKIQMPFGRNKRGEIVCGFYRSNTHDLVPVDTCYIEDERSKHILDEIKLLMKRMRIAPYEEDKREGVLRHVLIRTSFYRKEIMVVLVTAMDSFPGRNNFVKALTSSCPEITTVVQNINKRDTNVILGEGERVLYGPGFIHDSLCGVEFKISAKSFYQTNPVTTEKLYEFAIKNAKLDGNCRVFDAYSGIGTIGLIASKRCKEVLSVELVKEAVNDAKKNAERNGIRNVKAFLGDASDFMVDMARNGERVDVLFMDPPRKGSDEKFLNACLKLLPKRIVYISCDPSSLARDLVSLKGKYEIEVIQPFDMFPMTTHVETVACLRLKER